MQNRSCIDTCTYTKLRMNRVVDWLVKFSLFISSSILWSFIPCISFLSILTGDNLDRILKKELLNYCFTHNFFVKNLVIWLHLFFIH